MKTQALKFDIKRLRKSIDESPWDFSVLDEDFGQVLKSLRLKKNLTQIQLGKFLGIRQVYLSELEHGKKRFHVSFLNKCANFFEIPLSQIIMGAESFASLRRCNMKEEKKKNVFLDK